MMVTVSPTYPLAALTEPPLRVICGVMVKVADAEKLPPVTRTVFAPAALAGTVKVTLEIPPEVLVLGDMGLVISNVPSYFTVTPLEAAKPVPETVNVSPT
jgi:hypothetical protein